MVKDDQAPIEPRRDSQRTSQSATAFARGIAFKLAAVGLAAITLSAASGFLMVHWLQQPGDKPAGGGSAAPATPAPRPKPPLFKGWPQPDFVLVLSAQQFGHLQECGCSVPQRGGLVRRHNVMQSLKKRGWKVIALDLGDIAQRHGPQGLPNIQGLIKYRYSMMALRAMDYSAVGVGMNEMYLPLFPAVGELALQYSRPRVLAANLKDKNNEFPGDVKPIAQGGYQDQQPSLIGDWQLESVKVGDKELKVGIVGVVGPSVAEKVRNQNLQFASNKTVIPAVLKDMDAKGKPDFRVLLYQGTERSGKKSEAQACAEQYPQFQVVMGLSEEDEPSAGPSEVVNKLVIGVGQKGKNIGVVGVYRTGDARRPFDLRYQLVALDPEWETPANEEKDHPIMKLMEEYTQELKANNYLAKYILGKHPVQVAFPNATYVGNNEKTCQKCHGAEDEVWQDPNAVKEGRHLHHSHAWQSLLEAKKPSLRQFDAECVVCHSTGFGYKTGYDGDATKLHLLNVTCEACHGPASEHVADSKNVAKRAILNPWKKQKEEKDDAKRIARIDLFCQKCHDIENDVHWKTLKEKWERGVDHCFRNPLVFPKGGK